MQISFVLNELLPIQSENICKIVAFLYANADGTADMLMQKTRLVLDFTVQIKQT